MSFRSGEIVLRSLTFFLWPMDRLQTLFGWLGSMAPTKDADAKDLPHDLLKQGVELCRFYRLLQHRCVRKC
jgi:hypothetical protein